MEFGRKHLPDRFYLERDQRKSLRNIITREMIANTLIHREYTSTYQAKFVIEKSRMYIENANRAFQDAVFTSDCTEPHPKNPIIADFFRNIGYADKLGSGVRNLYKYSKIYSGKDPEFMESDVFRIIVPLDEKLTGDNTTQSTTQSNQWEQIKAVMAVIRQNPEFSQRQVAEQLGLNPNTVKYYFRKLQEQGQLKRMGSSRKGKWILEE